MKRLGILLLLLAFTLTPYAQQKRAKKPAAKKTAVTKKSTNKGKTGKKGTKQPSVQTLQNERQQIQKQIKGTLEDLEVHLVVFR